VPDERARILGAWKAAQDLRQIRRSDLAGSTRAVAERGQADLLLGLRHAPPIPAAAGGGNARLG
jgi:hypothetical protein